MTHDATELFECAAEAFRAATGYPAIGKDAGPEYGGEAWQKERERLWMVFRAGYQRSLLDGRVALAAAQRENETMREDIHKAIRALMDNVNDKHRVQYAMEALTIYEEAALSGQGGA